MAAYVVRRIVLVIPTLILVSIITFLLVRLMPGSIVDVIVNEMMVMSSSAGANVASTGAGQTALLDRDAILNRLGLSAPVHTQYLRWVGALPGPHPLTGEVSYNGLLQGNLGTSLRTGQSISEVIMPKLAVTFELSLMIMIITVVIAIYIGILSAIRQGTWLDSLGRPFAILSLATPAFWLAPILIVYGAVYLDWSPAVEYVRFTEDPLQNLWRLFIPAVLMGTAGTGGMMRYLRTLTLEVLRQDYIRTAWSKGLRERVVVVRHALRNAMVPLLNMFVPMIGALIGGSVIMENIFALPGMGRYTLNTILQRDYWVVSGMNLFFATITMAIIVITDLSYAWADPRIRYK